MFPKIPPFAGASSPFSSFSFFPPNKLYTRKDLLLDLFQVEHGKQNAPCAFILVRAGLKESGEKEDLKATGERAVEEAIVGSEARGRGGGEEGVAREGETQLDFRDRRYC